MAGADRPANIPAHNGTGWFRQASVAVNWLLQRVGDYASSAALAALETLVARKTGWAVYNDTAGTQTVSGGVRTVLTVNAGTKIESQMPDDVSAFWDSSQNEITGRSGDAIVVKVQCIFTPSDATASGVLFEVDIAGAVGVVEAQKFTVADGAGVAHPLAWTFLAYTLDTWEGNGGKVYVTANGPGDFTTKRVLIARVHKAR